jgi:hypothetical protein
MISLFRKIRQKLLEENKVTRYLVYALGEIILVVIGILIALQLNTWKEERADRNAEINFYEAVLADFEKDQAKIIQLQSFYEHRIEVCTWLLTRVRNPEIEVDPLAFGQNVEPLYYNESAISFDATFDAGKSSGAFNQFRQKELLKGLIQYYSEFSQIEDVMTSTLRIIENEFEPLMSPLPKNYLSDSSSNLVMAEGSNKSFYAHLGSVKDYRTKNSEEAIRSFLQKAEFESYLVGDLGRAFHTIARLEIRKAQIDSLTAEINQFLQN